MSTTDTFTANSTWTCPAYVTVVWSRCWAGGGSAGGVTAAPTVSLTGGGGAGGAFAEKLAYPVTPGATYTVTVGAAKTGSTGAGSAGNDTWFDNPTTGVLAKGGAGGSSPPTAGASGVGGAGSTAGSIGDNVWAGGSGGLGLADSITFTGPGGGGAGSGASGSAGSGISGGGGGSASGGAGGNGRTTPGAGTAGSTYGGGGAGAFGTVASHSFAGGNGAPGRMELEYTPTFAPSGGGIRAISDDPVDTASAPATIDTLTPVSGDVFLLLNGTNGGLSLPQFTGLWSWSSAGAAMTQVMGNPDGSYLDVREGTHAGARVFVYSAPFVPGAGGAIPSGGDIYFVNPFDTTQVIQGGPGPGGYVGVCPTVGGGGSWVVTHNLGSQFLIVAVAATAAPYAYVIIGPGNWVVERTDPDTLTVKPPAGISAGAYELMARKAV